MPTPTRLEIDLDRFKQARADSIWRHGGGEQANADALRALRAAIVDECRKVLEQHAAAVKQTIGPESPSTIGDKVKALEDARAALEGLKR